MDTTISVSTPIIIPSYEPDERMISLLKALDDANLSPVIIVNDGSDSRFGGYFSKAADYGAIVLKHDVNKGKGRALKTAFDYCLDAYPEMIGCVTADSDGQHTPEAILAVKERLTADALILGVRDFDAEQVPRKSRFGNELTRKVFNWLYKKDISDTQTGLRGIPKKSLPELIDVTGDRFEYETRMLIWAIENDIRIVEVPIETIYDSKENHSTHFRPVVDSLRVYSCFGMTFWKYVLSSLSSSVIDVVLFQLLCPIFASMLVLPYVAVATIGARCISALYNYLVNFHFVFNSSNKHTTSAVRYFSVAIVQMLLSAGLTSWLVMLTHASVESFVKIPVDVCLFFLSYQVQKRFVY